MEALVQSLRLVLDASVLGALRRVTRGLHEILSLRLMKRIIEFRGTKNPNTPNPGEGGGIGLILVWLNN